MWTNAYGSVRRRGISLRYHFNQLTTRYAPSKTAQRGGALSILRYPHHPPPHHRQRPPIPPTYRSVSRPDAGRAFAPRRRTPCRHAVPSTVTYRKRPRQYVFQYATPAYSRAGRAIIAFVPLASRPCCPESDSRLYCGYR